MDLDLDKLMEQAQKMQSDLVAKQEELAATVYTGNTGGNDGVTIEMTGDNEVQKVTIAPELSTPENREMLEDMLVIAFNNALAAADDARREKLGGLAAGMNIPGL